MKVQPPSPRAGPAKGIPFEAGRKGTTVQPAAPSLPTIEILTRTVKSAAKLPKAPAGVQANEITTPALNVPPSTPRALTQGGNEAMKTQPPSTMVAPTKSVSSEGELKGTTELATAPSLRTIAKVTLAVKSTPELPNTPSAMQASDITTPVLSVGPSTPRVRAHGRNGEMKVQPPSRKAGQARSFSFEGELNKTRERATAPSIPRIEVLTPAGRSAPEFPKTPSAVHANEIATPLLNVSPSKPRVRTQEGNVVVKIYTSSRNLAQTKNGSLESGLNKPSEGLPNHVVIPKLKLPTSAPRVPMQGVNAAIKIQPPSSKIEQPKSVSFEGGPKTITKPAIAPSLRTIQRLTPTKKSPAELPRTPSTLHAEITTPRLNIPTSAPIVAIRGVNVATKILPPSPMIEEPKSEISGGELKRITELATTSSHPAMESSTPALKSAAELPRTPSAVHAHKISTPVFNAPLLTPRVPKGASNVATKMPLDSLKVSHMKSAPIDDILKRTPKPALAPSLLKVEKFSHGGKSVAELAKQPSAQLVKGIITTGLNMRPSASKVPTLGRNEGAKMPPPGESVAQTKGASNEVEPKRATEPVAGSSQFRKLGASISAELLPKKTSGRLAVKENPMGSIFPPTIIPVFTKASNAPKNVQPPGPNVLHPMNVSFERELKGSEESAIGPSFNKTHSFIPALKSEAGIPKERSALLKKEITYAGVTTPSLLGIAGTEVIKVQPPTPNVSQPTPVSVAASLIRSASRIGNGLTEFEIAKMNKTESKIVPKILSNAANISLEKVALSLPAQDVSRKLGATSNVPINQHANLNVVGELATSSLLSPLKKPAEANFTSLSAGPQLTKNEVAKKTHKQPPVSVLLQPASRTYSPALNIFAKSHLVPHAGPYAKHAGYHTHNEGPSNERLTSLKFLPHLAQIALLDAAPPNNADQGHLFEATLRAISHNIGNPVQTQSTFREMMKPVRGSPQLTTLIEQARLRNFMNRRLGAPEAKNLLFRGNILYNTEPLRQRNGLENYALFGTREIWPFQQPSSLRSRALLEGKLGAMNSQKFFGFSPYLLKPQKPIQPPHFMYEPIRVLPDRVTLFQKSSISVLKRLYEFLDIKKPDGWNGYASDLINAQLYLRLYATLPYWHSATFEYFLSQTVESSHDFRTRQKFRHFIPKAGRNVRDFFLPLSTPPTRVPVIPLRNLASIRTRGSHFLPKTDLKSRYAHQWTAFVVLPPWHPKTFEHILEEEVESRHDLVRSRDFAPSIRNGGKYVTGSISPLRAYFLYSARNSPKATATSGRPGASHSPGSMNVESRKLYSSNALERQPSLPLLYAMQSPWYPRTVEHVLSQEGKGRKGLQLKRVFFSLHKKRQKRYGSRHFTIKYVFWIHAAHSPKNFRRKENTNSQCLLRFPVIQERVFALAAL
uniref:Mucin n=1 Tax=Rhipicephalus zambeziensis TaxID=60191 RepID=A0A224YF97_9ACAR